MVIPQLRIIKGTKLTETSVRLLIANNLFHHTFSYLMPDKFSIRTNKKNYQADIALYIFMKYCNGSVNKEINLKNFFSHYASLSNQTIRKVQFYFVESIHGLYHDSYIEDFYNVKNNSVKKKLSKVKDQDSVLDLLNGIVLYEKFENFKKI